MAGEVSRAFQSNIGQIKLGKEVQHKRDRSQGVKLGKIRNLLKISRYYP